MFPFSGDVMSGVLGRGAQDCCNQEMPGESKGLSGCEN